MSKQQAASIHRRSWRAPSVIALSALLSCTEAERASHQQTEPLSWQTSAPLKAADHADKDLFGFSVAIAERLAVVGAIGHQHSGLQGSAYAFRLTEAGWKQDPDELLPRDAKGTTDIGISVSASGQRVALGSQSDGSSLAGVWIFDQAGAGWEQSGDKLEAFEGGLAYEPTSADGFGTAVALDGAHLLVGAPYASLPSVCEDCGAVFYFEREGGVWLGKQVLFPSSPSGAQSEFGMAVAIHGSSAVVGASADDEDASGAGAAYYFERENGVWMQKQKLKGRDADGSDNDLTGASFGWSVAISEDAIAVGAPYEVRDFQLGSAIVYDRRAGLPFHVARKHLQDVADGANGNELIGFAVAASDELAAVGAPTAPSSGPFHSGRVAILNRASDWDFEFPLYPPVTSPNTFFGGSLALRGQQIIVGAPEDEAQHGTVFVSGLQKGSTCTSHLDCHTGFCVEGVCCDTACDGGCVSCLAELQDGGETGKCGPIEAGTDPKRACSQSAETSCGETGSCDGAGNCAIKAKGTPCGDGECDGGTARPRPTCDGRERCVPSRPKVCAPGYACRKGDCAQACESDEQCDLANGFACADGACGVVPGGQCEQDSDCLSGTQCSRGTCCSSVCDGPCQSCDSSGTCRDAPDGPSLNCAEGDVCHAGLCVSETSCSDDTTRELHVDGTERKCENTRCLRGSCVERCTRGSDDCAPGYTCRREDLMCVVDQPKSQDSTTVICTFVPTPKHCHCGVWAAFAAVAWASRRQARRRKPCPLRASRTDLLSTESRQ